MNRALAKAAARNLARVRTLESLTAPAVGEIVELPGGLRAFGAHAPFDGLPGEACEMCGEPIIGACYLIPIGGGYTVVHAACLGECR